METKKLFLRESDIRLEYRRKERQLRYIYVKHNKLIELLGNKVLTEENISEKEKIVLIKAGKTLEIPLEKGSGYFGTSKVKYRTVQERVVRFEVSAGFFITESMIKKEFGPKQTKPFFKQKIQIGVNSS